ncbi:MAG TPA: LysR family transcriptional regulator [Pseudolabrys sp.]|nr:LysR family transcriptional regulator [Pseudolabrys sp.]
MQMHQVNYFLAVCDERSFTRAARRCGVSQPSLTRAIKLMEDELGSGLFVRHRRGARPTSLGMLLHADLAQIERSIAAVKCKAATFNAGSAGGMAIEERALMEQAAVHEEAAE